MNYCKMWQSLIRSDLEGIKQSSKALGVEEMYGLLACILTARSWEVITTGGIDQGPVTDDEAEEIRTSAATYVTEITELLNRVPRQLLLLLKTNDLLRSIDYRLNTSDTSRSFITMSRCCIRALTKQRLKTCDGWRDWFRIQADSTMSHLRITLYQMYVSGVFLSLRRLFTSLMGALTFLWYRVTGVRLYRLNLRNVNLLTELNTFDFLIRYLWTCTRPSTGVLQSNVYLRV